MIQRKWVTSDRLVPNTPSKRPAASGKKALSEFSASIVWMRGLARRYAQGIWSDAEMAKGCV